MIAFFFTMPISRIMPISATTLKFGPVIISARIAPDARRRQRRKNGDRVNVALIKNAEDDINRDECRENQQRLVRQRRYETPAAVP